VTEDQTAHLVRDDVRADELAEGVHAPVEAGESSSPVQRTGNDAVDGVLDSLDALVDTPVAEHVAVFEAAHDQLRAALADAGDTRPAQG
jgi:hypothetical protein